MSRILKKYRFDFNFYVRSYQDLRNFNASEAEKHFIEYGVSENRFCSAYHFFLSNEPRYSELISIDEYLDNENAAKDSSPLQLCEQILQDLTFGLASKRDTQFFSAETQRPGIAGHGRIREWTRQFNKPNIKVLEVGSRSVASKAKWKEFIPQVDYTGLDIIEGDNVDVIGDAHCLSDYFDEESFDLIISFAVFEHLAMPWLVAEEISKLLKVDGHLAIETHFAFSEHELPWHFFQFNCNGLKSLFNEALGMQVLDYGLDNPIIGRFAEHSRPHLRNLPVPNLYCHSSIIAKKYKRFDHEFFEWRNALPEVIGDTMYPKGTGISKCL